MTTEDKAIFEARFIPAFGENNLVPVEKLKIGMFVTELDIPWTESPFSLQGFKITDESEIKALQKLCRYVYIK